MTPAICQELKIIIMVFITLIKNNTKYTYSLQFFTFLSNSFHVFLQFFSILSIFLTILFIFSYNSFQSFSFFQFFSILSIFSYNSFQFFSSLFNSFHFFLQFFPILSNSSVNSKELSKNWRIWKELPEKNWRISENFWELTKKNRNRFLLLYSTSGF